jgi:hypothetical protein
MGWPAEVCAPLLVLNVIVWAIQQTLQEVLPKSLYALLLLILAATCLFVQELLSVVVLRVGFVRSSGDSSPVVWGEVLGWKRLIRTITALYGRYVLWSAGFLIAVGLVWSVGMAIWFMAHQKALAASQHEHHSDLTFVFLELWVLSTYVFLSRYQFVLPLIGIAGEVRADSIRVGVILAKAHWGAVVRVTLLEELVLMVPIAAALHFLRPVLEPIRFAYGGLELVTTIVSALLAAWFLLVKLDLAKQALRVSGAGETT